ncbi:MAG: tyrosine-type recombinase/integrase [Chitinophagaceae bacterium]
MLIHVKAGKGKKDRPVMMDQKVLVALRDYFAEHRPKEYLFNGQNDSLRYSASSIRKFIKNYAVKAVVSKRVHPHLFRHNFATGVLENGGSLYDTQILLGHDSPTTTANFYAHLSPKYIASIKSPIANINLVN